MINFAYVTKITVKEHNPNSPQCPDHPHRILKIGDSGLEKRKALFNLILYATDLYGS